MAENNVKPDLKTHFKNTINGKTHTASAPTPSTITHFDPLNGKLGGIDSYSKAQVNSCTPQRQIPIGQLASLLQEKKTSSSPSSKSKMNWNTQMGLGSSVASSSSLVVFSDDLNRSTSAPPAEAIHFGTTSQHHSSPANLCLGDLSSGNGCKFKSNSSAVGEIPHPVPPFFPAVKHSHEQVISHPNYAAYYYSQSRLNPRLPPPVYTPGQSWHHYMHWSSSFSWNFFERKSLKNDTEPSTPTVTPDDEAEHIQATLRNLSLDCSAEDYFSNDDTSSLFNSFRRPTAEDRPIDPTFSQFEENTADAISSRFASDAGSNYQHLALTPPQLPSNNTTTPSDGGFSLHHECAPLKEAIGEKSYSSLLEEFRISKGSRRFTIKEILPCVIEFSGDQFGSRYIQQRLENSSTDEKEAIFRELLPRSVTLMTDVFGNYVIQKFFELGSETQRAALALQMQGHVVNLSLQMYGCRVVQKALENLPCELQSSLISELSGHVIRCVKDQNGNHVIQKLIEKVPSHLVQFVVDSFKGQVAALAMHPYGCRVLQRIFEHCAHSQSMPLLGELHQHSDELVVDQYGNYVIQHVIEKGTAHDRSCIIKCVRGKLIDLSRHKFASNVVEKSMAYSSPTERRIMIDEILNAGPTLLSVMMKDPFANYVVQRMLDVADPDQKDQLVSRIKPHLSTLKKYTYGKHIISKVERILAVEGL